MSLISEKPIPVSECAGTGWFDAYPALVFHMEQDKLEQLGVVLKEEEDDLSSVLIACYSYQGVYLILSGRVLQEGQKPNEWTLSVDMFGCTKLNREPNLLSHNFLKEFQILESSVTWHNTEISKLYIHWVDSKTPLQ